MIPAHGKIPNLQCSPSSYGEHPANPGRATETTCMGWSKTSQAGRQGSGSRGACTPSSAACPPLPPCFTWPGRSLFHPKGFTVHSRLINSRGTAHCHGNAGSPGKILPSPARCLQTPDHHPWMLTVVLSPPAPSTISFLGLGTCRHQQELPPVITELI